MQSKKILTLFTQINFTGFAHFAEETFHYNHPPHTFTHIVRHTHTSVEAPFKNGNTEYNHMEWLLHPVSAGIQDAPPVVFSLC